MRHLVTLFVLALATAAPVSARTVGSQVPTPSPRVNPFIGDSRLPAPAIGRELRDVRSRIDQARNSGDLSAREARQLHREARLIGRLADRYGRGGLSPSERSELQVRTQVLRGSIGRAR